MSQPLIRARIFDGFAAFLEKCGGKLEPLLAQEGLPLSIAMPDSIGLTDTIPLKAAANLLEAASRQIGDRCLALKYGDQYIIGPSPKFGQLLVRAQSVQAALALMPKLMSTLTTHIDARFELEPSGLGRVTVGYPPIIDVSTAQLTSYLISSGLRRLGVLSGEQIVPFRVETCHPMWPCATDVKRILGPIVVQIGGDISYVLFAKHQMAKTNPNFDPALFDHLLAQSAGMIIPYEEAEPQIVTRTKAQLTLSLSRAPLLLDVATALGMSDRSLQNQLEQAETTYEKVLNTVRQQAAARLLSSTDMPIADVSYELGFSQPSSFSRACTGWFGMTPREYRQATPEERRLRIAAKRAQEQATGDE